MKKIKIAMFMDNYYPQVDGVVVTIDNYAKRLMKYADVVVVVPSFGKKIDNSVKLPYKVIRVRSIRVNAISYNVATPEFDLRTLRELKKEKFDIIHIHSPFIMGKLGIRLAKEENIPVVATMHSQFKRDFKRYVKSENLASMMTKQLMKTFNDCNECWAVNEKMGLLYQSYGYTSKPYIMNNATDMEPIKDYKKGREEINHKYKLSNDDIVLLFVGRMYLLKNILFIADVLNELKNKNFKFKMLFIGGGKDIIYLKERLNEYHLKKDVIFGGEVQDRELLAKIYARGDLFVFPSMYDASSLVQIEAASQKTPTIFLENSITSSTTKNNINGYIGKDDPSLFADKIITIFSDKDKYQKVCNNAFKEVYKKYDDMTIKIYDRYLKIIKEYRKK